MVGDACFKPEAPRAAGATAAATDALATLDMTNAILMIYEILLDTEDGCNGRERTVEEENKTAENRVQMLMAEYSRDGRDAWGE